jgi:hypothetical protein
MSLFGRLSWVPMRGAQIVRATSRVMRPRMQSRWMSAESKGAKAAEESVETAAELDFKSMDPRSRGVKIGLAVTVVMGGGLGYYLTSA